MTAGGRILGGSEVAVPPIVLGGNIFGHFLDAAASTELIAEAASRGLTAIDTADVYSDGLSEEAVGLAIAGRRSEFTICTKIGIHSGEKPDGRFGAGAIKRAIEDSLRRLRTDHVDLYQMHAYDPITPLEESLTAFADLVREGKIRAYGLSNFPPERLQQAVETAAALGLPPPASVQVWWNLLDRSAGETLAAVCAPIGVSILPYGVLARGLLSGKYSSGEVLPAGSRAESSATLRSDLTPERLAAAQRLAEVAARSGRSSVSLACAWILAQRGVPACIVGVRTPEQLREIVAAADIAFEESEAQEIASFVNDGRKT